MQKLNNSKIIQKIKKSDVFETLKHSKNYFFADVATNALAVVSVPIFTRLLSEADYGMIALFQAYSGIMIALLSLNAYTAVSRYFYENKEDFKQFVGTTLVFVFLIFGSVALPFCVWYRHIGDVMGLPGLLPIFLIFICLFQILRSIYIQILIPQKKSKEVAIINTVKGYAAVAFGIVFVYLLKENKYLGRIWANLLVFSIFSVFFLLKLRKYTELSVNFNHIKYIAHFSFPLIPSTLSGTILSQFDRIMISSTLGLASAGLYSLGYNIGTILLIAVSAIQMAIIPDFYKFIRNNEYDRLDFLIKRIFSFITIAALGLVFFAKEIGMVLADKKFHPGLTVVPVIVIAYTFFAMYLVYGKYITYEKKTYYSSIVVLSSGMLNIVLNVLLIPRYGYIAAAYTTLVSYFFLFLLTWGVVKKISEQRITPLWVIWKPAALMFGFIFFNYIINQFYLEFFIFFSIKVAMLLLFSIIVFWRESKFLYHGIQNM
jgi:O-antigen/teichoic acid export membrane protein